MIDAVDVATQQMVIWYESYQFLSEEAERLDDDRMEDWLDLLAADVTYEMPIRQTRKRGEQPMAHNGWHMHEDIGSLRNRVARLSTKAAWAEDPPSRTKRLVGNVRARATDVPDEFAVTSNVMLYRGRGDSPEYALLVAERQDVLRRTEEGLRLARRVILLSHTTLPTQNLGVFL
ncbi:MAG: aromatic-ring-hydroxylating dioxygenase beta subunit [Acidimicrobiales bacterium]|nr:aromatic-ring-hydroxylating dioxygenase beta subunit [Acidimicrobiales bacterium]